MRKTILILGAAGIGAGFLYALGFNRERQKSKADNGSATPSEKEPKDESVVPSVQNLANDENNSNNEMPIRAASMARIENGMPTSLENVEPEIDDRGTDQFEASQILKNIRDTAFESSDEKLALALGRPTQEIQEWTQGAGVIDGDAVMKARALALQRGVEVE